MSNVEIQYRCISSGEIINVEEVVVGRPVVAGEAFVNWNEVYPVIRDEVPSGGE